MRIYEIEYDIQNIIKKFKKEYHDSISYGCKRDNCGIPASDFELYCEKLGLVCPRIRGFFKVDKLKLSLKDFTKDEKKMINSQNISNEVLIKFSEKIGIKDSLYYIPHYWNTLNGKIIDFTAHNQFVKTGLALDTTDYRYYQYNDLPDKVKPNLSERKIKNSIR
jgi:hypothetical protein